MKRRFDIDVFAASPILKALEGRKFGNPYFLGIGLFATLLAVGAIDGTLGSLDADRFFRDISSIFGVECNRPNCAEPSFPILRDGTSAILFTAFVFAYGLARVRWRLMETCIGDLYASGSLAPIPSAQGGTSVQGVSCGTIRSTVRSKFDHSFRRKGADGRSDRGADLYRSNDSANVERIMKSAEKRLYFIGRRWVTVPLVAASLLLSWVAVHSTQDDLFREFTPSTCQLADLGVSEDEWVSKAGDSWWAGQHHTLGRLFYIAVASTGIYLLLVQIAVAGVAFEVVTRVNRCSVLGADWLDRDGAFGWRSVGAIFRTVHLSMLVYSFGIGIAVLTVGGSHPIGWGMIGVWCVITSLYYVIPWWVFHDVPRRAKDARRAELAVRFSGIDFRRDLATHAVAVAEYQRLNRARIRPMTLPRRSLGLVPVVVVVARYVIG